MTKHIAALDGLRALSISIVIFAHLSDANMIPKALHATSLGREGVLIFFVISGYLITLKLVREKELTGTINVGSFLLQRAFRLLPASLLLIATTVVLNRLGYVGLNRGDVIHALTYTMDYASSSGLALMHLWSLSVEEQFYLLWPFALLLAWRGPRVVCYCVLVVCPLSRLYSWHVDPDHFVIHLRRFDMVADSLAIGCLLAMRQRTLPKWSRSNQAIVCSFAIILTMGFLRSRAPGIEVVATTIVSICAAVIIHSLNLPALWLSRCFSFPALAWLGTISYSLYLWQELFTSATPNTLPPILFVFPYNVLVAMACATFSYYVVEGPIRAWGRRIRPAKAGKPVGIGAAA